MQPRNTKILLEKLKQKLKFFEDKKIEQPVAEDLLKKHSGLTQSGLALEKYIAEKTTISNLARTLELGVQSLKDGKSEYEKKLCYEIVQKCKMSQLQLSPKNIYQLMLLTTTYDMIPSALPEEYNRILLRQIKAVPMDLLRDNINNILKNVYDINLFSVMEKILTIKLYEFTLLLDATLNKINSIPSPLSFIIAEYAIFNLDNCQQLKFDAFSNAHTALNLFAKEEKNTNLSLQEINQALLIEPTNAQYLHIRASILSYRQEYEPALIDINNAINKIQKMIKTTNFLANKNFLSKLYFLKATILLNQLTFDDAVAYFEKSATLIGSKSDASTLYSKINQVLQQKLMQSDQATLENALKPESPLNKFLHKILTKDPDSTLLFNIQSRLESFQKPSLKYSPSA